MMVLHGVWRPSGEGLALWGEGGENRRNRRSKTPRHPFPVEGGPLRDVWREMGGGSEGDPSITVRLLLPTAAGQPLPSLERARMGDEATASDAKEASLVGWLVPAL